jgi:hypothetical protein
MKNILFEFMLITFLLVCFYKFHSAFWAFPSGVSLEVKGFDSPQPFEVRTIRGDPHRDQSIFYSLRSGFRKGWFVGIVTIAVGVSLYTELKIGITLKHFIDIVQVAALSVFLLGGINIKLDPVVTKLSIR